MRAETLTLIQALLLFALAIHLGGLVIYVLKDPNEQKAFSSYALYAFAGGINLGDLSVPAAHRLLTTYIDYHKGHHRLRDRGYNVFTALECGRGKASGCFRLWSTATQWQANGASAKNGLGTQRKLSASSMGGNVGLKNRETESSSLR